MFELDEEAQFEIEEAQRKVNEAQIIAELEALSPTKFSIPYVHMMDSRIGTLEKTIKGLKGFISFLSKLNPMEYLRWMSQAFSGYIASSSKTSTTTQPADNLAALPTPTTNTTISVRATNKRTKAKRNKTKIPS